MNFESCTRPAQFLAADIVNWIHKEDQSDKDLQLILSYLKNRKHPHHKKFTTHILNNLNTQNPQVQTSVVRFIEFGKIYKKLISSQIQIVSIFEALKSYWEKANKKLIRKMLLQNYFDFHEAVSEEVIKVFNSPLIKQNSPQNRNRYQEFAKQMIVSQISTNQQPLSQENSRKCLALMYYLDITSQFKVDQVVELLTLVDIQKHDYIFYRFSSNKPNKQKINEEIVSAYIYRMGIIEKQLKKATSFIKAKKLNAFEYPYIIKGLNKNSIYFFFNSAPLDSLQLSFRNRQDILQSLVQVLISKKKFNDVSYLVNKYHLENFDEYFDDTLVLRKNEIQSKDNFQPTEHFLRENEKNYLHISKFGYSLKDVKFVDSNNIIESDLQAILKSQKIGIDCENSMIFNAFENSQTVLFQLATPRLVYLFDVSCLKKNSLFQNFVKNLMETFKGKIIGHTTKSDIKDLLKDMNLSDIKIKPTIIDVSLMYKMKYPKENKISLKNIVQHIFEYEISKFEQCSCWSQRPLRKAQLHYAALDAVLPLKVYDCLL